MNLRTYYIEADSLDPITVVVIPKNGNAARIIVQCYTKAWTAYWGNPGTVTIERFISTCDKEYIADYMFQGASDGMTSRVAIERQRQYVERIAQALIDHFIGLEK